MPRHQAEISANVARSHHRRHASDALTIRLCLHRSPQWRRALGTRSPISACTAIRRQISCRGPLLSWAAGRVRLRPREVPPFAAGAELTFVAKGVLARAADRWCCCQAAARARCLVHTGGTRSPVHPRCTGHALSRDALEPSGTRSRTLLTGEVFVRTDTRTERTRVH